MKDRLINFIRDSRYAIVISIFALLIVIIGWASLRSGINRQIEREFIIRSEEVVLDINNQLESSLKILASLKGLYASSEYVSRKEWQDFIVAQDISDNYLGVRALEYVERVSDDKKNDFISRIKSEGFDNFIIKNESVNYDHFVVNYIEPLKGNESVFGFDLSSSPNRLLSLNNARDANNLFITEPIKLIQSENSSDQLSFLAMLPIYVNLKPFETLDDRRLNIAGLALAAVDPNFLLKEINEKSASHVNFLLSDSGDYFFESSVDNTRDSDGLVNKTLYFSDHIEIGGRLWLFESYPTDQFIANFDNEKKLTNIALYAGIFFTILLFFVIMLIFRSRRIAIEIAENMTNNFNLEKTKVEKINIDLQKSIEMANKSIQEQDKQRSAILNVLEDIEVEKNKTEIIANDLKKFQLAVNNASDQIVITDQNGIILHANSALERITGFKVKDSLGQKAGSKKTWGGRMSEEFYKQLWKTIKIDKKTFSGEVLNHRKNGIEYTALANITPVLDKNGEVVYFVAIERDITREKEVDKMKTEFVSVASHQLRTPLTAIRWYVEEIYNGEFGKLNKEQKDYLKQVLESNDRMIKLVNDLLNVSRLETGRVTIEPVPTNIMELINEVVAESNVLAQARNCKLIFIKPKTKLPDINIDPALIRQVVNNLVSNAVKYSKFGDKSLVTIKLSKKVPNVIISVKDNGIGIPKENQYRIFDKFFRAENAVKTETEGTGLGLYIAKTVVESSGGKIWFSSDKKGTEFAFSLPLAGSKAYKGEKGLS